jgi:hypothetical protein
MSNVPWRTGGADGNQQVERSKGAALRRAQRAFCASGAGAGGWPAWYTG